MSLITSHPSGEAVSSGHSSQPPFFRVGCERSGTTMTSLMLAHHPRLAFDDFYFTVEMIPDEGGWPDLAAYYAYLGTDRTFQASGLAVDKALDYPRLVDSFLRQKQRATGKPIVGGKIRENYHRVLWVWPDARFIHLVRDGRDVARSLIGMGWVGNMFTGAEYWLRAVRGWDRLCEMVREDRRIEVRYEDLVSDPEVNLRLVCDFLRVPYDPAMLNYPKDSTYDAPSRQFAAQWRRKLSIEEIELAESLMADMLMKRGYELSGYARREIDPALERRLRRQDRWYRARFRLRRYGLPVYLADIVTRRLGLSSLQRRVRLRMNAIETRYLK